MQLGSARRKAQKDQENKKEKTVLALGCFDGLHEGHTRLLKKAAEIADENSLGLAVYCFSEPPKNFFYPSSVPVITPKDEKLRIISSLGAAVALCVDFDESIANMPPEAFFEEVVLSQMNAAHVVCGFNYRFGKNGTGDTQTLRRLCIKEGIGIDVIDPVQIDGVTVSSSEIRIALASARPERAARLLGRPYSIFSRVVDGKRLGRLLGFPTINQTVAQASRSLLKHGVYATRSYVGQTPYDSVTNLGIRPTVDGSELCAETHLLDFCGDLYGKEVRVEFLHFIREERKFDTLEELSEQIKKDVDAARLALR